VFKAMEFKDLWFKIIDYSIEAKSIISKYTHTTPVSVSSTLSRIAGGTVYIKYENLQKTGSFKVRGALYKVYKVLGKSRGVVAASAGNHAQGVAYAASIFNIPSIIVMPETASISKIEATKSYGADVILYGKVFDESYRKALEIANSKGYDFIHAFDDIHVIAGQASLGLELLEQVGDFDVILVPIGGGGLISGVASILKYRRPNIKIIGVEPEAAPKMLKSINAGKPIEVDIKPSIADGLITKRPGDLTYTITSNLVDDIITVDEEELSQAIYFMLERKKTLVEGAGAASIAPIISGKIKLNGLKVVALSTGGNIDLTALNRIIIRGLSKLGRIARIAGYVPDYPGQLKRVLEVIASHRGNILDILHDRSDPRVPPWHAKVIILFEAPTNKTVEDIVSELKSEGYYFIIEI